MSEIRQNHAMDIPSLPGLHHVTAFAGDPQRNVDFYAGQLGLRLVKVTVNFDDPGTYHFYYGDGSGTPGSVITFFPWPNAHRGTIGDGQTVATAYSVPKGSLGFWRERLGDVREGTRFGAPYLAFEDPDGLRLELIETESERLGWADGPVPTEVAIRGFHSVTLQAGRMTESTRLLTETLGWKETESEGERRRFVGESEYAAQVDLLPAVGVRGRDGVGTVHHIAFRTPDDPQQEAWQARLREAGHAATPVQDRQYFHSIYFREPSGVLYEIATNVPGFATDEPEESLGTTFRLPSWLEPHREKIERLVAPIRTPQGVQIP